MGRYRKFEEDFRQGAVRLVLETGTPIVQVERELGINDGTPGRSPRPAASRTAWMPR